MKCIIIDDEPLARDIVETYVKQTPFLQLVASCKNAFEANEHLQKETIDLLFIDIEMPQINGITFVKNLNQPPLVIFTTAYSEYAIDGFDLQAVDYLLKPISPDRFLKAANKAHELFTLYSNTQAAPQANYIMVKSEYQSVKINFADILYIEGLKDYIKINTTNGMIITLMNMKKINEKLPQESFIRVHKSYIVAIDAIETIDRQRIIIGKNYIPIGNTYKKEFEARLGL